MWQKQKLLSWKHVVEEVSKAQQAKQTKQIGANARGRRTQKQKIDSIFSKARTQQSQI